MVGEELVREHVCTEGEGNTSVDRREVVRVVRDGILLSVVGVLGQDTRGDVAAGASCCKIEKLLGKFRVGCTVGVLYWCEPVTASNGSISLSLEMAVRADAGLVA